MRQAKRVRDSMNSTMKNYLCEIEQFALDALNNAPNDTSALYDYKNALQEIAEYARNLVDWADDNE